VDINNLPAGTALLVDANVIIYYLAGASNDCKQLFRRIATGDLEASITTTIIAEVLHRRMIGEAIAKGLSSSGQPLKKLKANSSVITQLTDYHTEVMNLLLLPINLVEVLSVDVAASQALRSAHGLFVNDSINLACALRVGIANIATHDADFGRVPWVEVWQPVDV
jgi:predicted nucleic acid-binding protein